MFAYLVVVLACLAVVAHGLIDAITAKDTIQSYVASYPSIKKSSTSYDSCTISSTESCNLSDMNAQTSTLVYPGGETRCIFSTSTPYAFQVFPGASDKVLLYFQGGGACWDKISTEAEFCTTDVSPQSAVGIFDRNNEKNAFRDFTIVHALYCSGDVWGGNTVRPYTDKAGVPVQQVGQINGQATIDWIKGQQAAGQLASTLSEFVVMGCSAGSIGAQLWSVPSLSQIPWTKAAVIPDSYAGVFPPGSMGPLIRSFGLCSWKWLPANLVRKCQLGTLSLQELDLSFMQSAPTVPFSFIQSKTDIVQESFYVAVGVTTPNTSASLTPAQFYDDVNDIFGQYNSQPNFLTYLVDGDQHCFTPLSLYYTADGLGNIDNNSAENQGPMMYEWTNQFPLTHGDEASTLCEGNLMYNRDVAKGRVAPAPRKGLNDNTYCSADVSPKTFVESY